MNSLVISLDSGAQLAAIVSEILAVASGAASVWFTLQVVITLAEAHGAAVSGAPVALASITNKVIPALICVIIAVNAHEMGEQFKDILGRATPTDAAGTFTLWSAIALVVIRTIIYCIGASLTVGFSTGALSAQLAVFTGSPNVLSNLKIRLLAVTLTGLGTVLSLTLVQVIAAVTH